MLQVIYKNNKLCICHIPSRRSETVSMDTTVRSSWSGGVARSLERTLEMKRSSARLSIERHVASVINKIPTNTHVNCDLHSVIHF